MEHIEKNAGREIGQPCPQAHLRLLGSATPNPASSGQEESRSFNNYGISFDLVREMGLEPTRHSTHAPQTCLSTGSSTLAYTPLLLRMSYYTGKGPIVNKELY